MKQEQVKIIDSAGVVAQDIVTLLYSHLSIMSKFKVKPVSKSFINVVGGELVVVVHITWRKAGGKRKRKKKDVPIQVEL